MATELPFVGNSYELDTLDVSAQRTVNMYLEAYLDSKAKVQMSLRPTHGLLSFSDMAGTNQMRGLYLASTGDFFGVRGSFVSTFDSSGTETTRFNIDTGNTVPYSTIVRMADNGTSMLIADGSTGPYVVTLSGYTAAKVTDADYPGGSFCAILDGFYIVNKPNTLFAFYSTLDDPTDWPSGNTITKESTTDYINCLIVHNSRLWIFGTQSYEVHYNTGNSNNQFLRIEGTPKSIGCEAPNSLAEDGNNVYWLSSDGQGFGQVMQSQGFDSMPISTIPMEREIHTYTTTSDAEGFCFQQDGHNFYQLTFPSENKTWVYDATVSRMLGSPAWHEKLFRNPNSGVDERHRARVQGFFSGKNLFGDWEDGNIYSAEQTTYTDNGNTIIRRRISPTHWNSLERLFFASFELDIESGVGLGTGQGSAPLVQLRWSNDGGHTWGNWYYLSAGAIGKYSTRVKKNRLGQSRKRVWEVRYSEPTKFNILSAFAELS